MNEKAKSESDREYLDSPDPERIWLAPKCEGLAPEGRFWCEHPRDCEECEMKSVEYIRADLALPPLRAREEIARALENAALFLEIGARYAPNEVVDQRIIATKERLKLRGLADVMRAVAEDCHALSRTADQGHVLAPASASIEEKCDAFDEAMTRLSRTAGQEWRDISSAPKEPMDGHAYGPTILLWIDGTVGVACWDYDFRKFYVEYPEGGSQPTHWMPLPAPPVAEPIVADKSEVKS